MLPSVFAYSYLNSTSASFKSLITIGSSASTSAFALLLLNATIVLQVFASVFLSKFVCCAFGSAADKEAPCAAVELAACLLKIVTVSALNLLKIFIISRYAVSVVLGR